MPKNPITPTLTLRITIDKSNYQYHTKSVQSMINKFPLEVKIIPSEWLTHIHDVLIQADRFCQDRMEREHKEFQELFKKAQEHHDKGGKK